MFTTPIEIDNDLPEGLDPAAVVKASTPLVTILTPTYQHERYIGQCIESVLRQTYTNWEQLIIDDGSADRTGEIARSYDDPRIRYLRQEHIGVWKLAETYNRGLHLAKGEVIAILEGDDFYAPAKLSLLVPMLAREIVLAYGRTALVVGNRVLSSTIPDRALTRRFGRDALYNQPTGACSRVMLRGLVPTFPCSTLIRRAALERIGGFQHVEGLGTVDVATFLELSLQGPFAYTEQIVAYWRRHEASSAWLNNDTMMLTVEAHTRAFAGRHAARIGLTESDIKKLEEDWHDLRALTAFRSGRRLLAERSWEAARVRFRAAMLSRQLPLLLGSLLGYFGSWLKFDLEGLFANAGRAHFTSGRRR